MIYALRCFEKSSYRVEASEKPMYHIRMSWLNYHHLLYFWTVAREGSIAKACEIVEFASHPRRSRPPSASPVRPQGTPF